MSTHRINASVQGAKMLLNLDLHSVFCKLTKPSWPSHDPHQIIFVFKTHAICLKLNLMLLKELMITVVNKQPEIQS